MATRVFAGTGGPNELITQAGRLSSIGGTVGTITYAALIRFGTVTDGGMMRAENASHAYVIQANNYLDHHIYWAQGGGHFESDAPLSDGYDQHLNTWMLWVASRASGAGTIRVHRYLFSGATWEHTNGTGSSLQDSTDGPISAVYHGSISSSQYGNFFMAADAIAPIDLTNDAAVEALGLELNAQAWVDAFTTGAAWLWNQTIETCPVQDITSGGAFQSLDSDRHGTAIAADVDDPPGFNFVLPHLFTDQVPNTTNNSDGGAAGITVSTTVRFLVDGFVTHVRFWATDTVSGTYVVELWQPTLDDASGATGALLASQVATGVTPGWNETELTTDGPIAVDTTHSYRVAVNSSDGRYVHRASVFVDHQVQNGVIIGLANNSDPLGFGTLANGVFAANSGPGTYPHDSGGNGSNYFVDVTFSGSSPTPPVGSDQLVWGTDLA